MVLIHNKSIKADAHYIKLVGKKVHIPHASLHAFSYSHDRDQFSNVRIMIFMLTEQKILHASDIHSNMGWMEHYLAIIPDAWIYVPAAKKKYMIVQAGTIRGLSVANMGIRLKLYTLGVSWLQSVHYDEFDETGNLNVFLFILKTASFFYSYYYSTCNKPICICIFMNHIPSRWVITIQKLNWDTKEGKI